jgi:hypothetical protein
VRAVHKGTPEENHGRMQSKNRPSLDTVDMFDYDDDHVDDVAEL